MSSINLWPVLNELNLEFVSNIKYFCVLGNENEVIIVTKNDKVFSFGNNSYRGLGLGHDIAVKESEIVNNLCDQQIIVRTIMISISTMTVIQLQ
jgi:alpha-tubulin suppressor-like RCC1 family protein